MVVEFGTLSDGVGVAAGEALRRNCLRWAVVEVAWRHY